MASVTTSEAARALALARHRKPENVERRVDALAEHIARVVDALPPLTKAQRDRLAALLRPDWTEAA
jgi:hypothetical protein